MINYSQEVRNKGEFILLFALNFLIVLVALVVLRKNRLRFKLELFQELSVLGLHFEKWARLGIVRRFGQLCGSVCRLGPLVGCLLVRFSVFTL